LRFIFSRRLLKDDEIEQLRGGGSKEIYFNWSRITYPKVEVFSSKKKYKTF